MKRKIAMLLVGLMCVSATGCSFGKQNNDIEKISAANIFADISEDAVVDGSTAADEFTKALSATEKLENVTINVTNGITMGQEGQENYQDSLNESEIKLAKDGDKNIGSVSIHNTYKSAGEAASGENAKAETEENSITGYYSGDTLYFITNDGDKVKEEMSYSDFLGVVSTYNLSVYSDCISKAACVAGKNSKTYYISYDPTKFETTMTTNMEASGQVLADGEAMKIKYANIIAEIDNDGTLLNYGFIINAEYVNDNNTIPYDYSIAADFSNNGKTKVDAVKDTDSYMTADEYTQKQQEAAQAASEAATTEATSNTENTTK